MQKHNYVSAFQTFRTAAKNCSVINNIILHHKIKLLQPACHLVSLITETCCAQFRSCATVWSWVVQLSDNIYNKINWIKMYLVHELSAIHLGIYWIVIKYTLRILNNVKNVTKWLFYLKEQNANWMHILTFYYMWGKVEY